LEDINVHSESRDRKLILLAAAFASVAAFIYYYFRGEVLNYGDAVAHINIARRVFDSRTPGLKQLGTVWLPLPHLLTIPFIAPDFLWRTGIGGSIPSMVAYVLGVLGIFRLVRSGLAELPGARVAAWVAAGIYGLNPNLLYMQATAMTESLSAALFIWAIVFMADFVRVLRAEGRASERSLALCALMLSGLAATRYDGWFAIGAFGGGLFLFWLLARRSWQPFGFGVVVRFALLVAIVPALWLGYNYKLFGNPLEFATGPYSARGIAERTTPKDAPPYPGKDSPKVAAQHFIKAAKLNLAGRDLTGEYHRYWRRTWQEDLWVVLALAGTLVAISNLPVLWPWLLLWIPVPFYALSIAYGGVPIFMPVWWPWSYYNVRYGLQLLPAAAVFVAVVPVPAGWWPAVRRVAFILLVAFVAISYWGTWRSGPITRNEAYVNSRARNSLHEQLSGVLREIPDSATLLMYTGEHVGVLQRTGIPLERTINENNWGLWGDALRNPEGHVDYAVAFGNDAVAQSMYANPGFESIAHIEVEGQSPATVYRRRNR